MGIRYEEGSKRAERENGNQYVASLGLAGDLRQGKLPGVYKGGPS